MGNFNDDWPIRFVRGVPTERAPNGCLAFDVLNSYAQYIYQASVPGWVPVGTGGGVLPTTGNLSVLGTGSGGPATAAPTQLIAGGNVTLTGGAGNITIDATGGGGGSAYIAPNAGSPIFGNPANGSFAATVQGSSNSSGAGGYLKAQGGYGSYIGGSAYINGGGGGQFGGDVTINSGYGGAAAGGKGGKINLSGGAGGEGGAIRLLGGTSTGNPGNGGYVSVVAGTPAHGQGGNISLLCGGSPDGSGGDLSLTTGATATAGKNSGNLTIAIGAATGGATTGGLFLVNVVVAASDAGLASGQVWINSATRVLSVKA